MKAPGWARQRRLTVAGIGRAGLAVLVLLASVFLFPGIERSTQFADIRPGEVAPRGVVADFNFDVMKSPTQLEFERRRAAETVVAYFRKDAEVGKRVLDRLERFSAELTEATGDRSPDTLRMLREMGGLGVDLSDRARRALLDRSRRQRVIQAGREFLSRVMEDGFADEVAAARIAATQRHMLLVGQGYSPVSLRGVVTPQTISQLVQETSRERFEQDPVASEAFRAVVAAFVTPNVYYDRHKTESLQEDEMAAVTPVERRVLEGELIVEAHRVVTSADVQVLDAYKEALEARRGGAIGWENAAVMIGRLLITAAILGFTIIHLRSHRPRVYADTRKLLLLTITALVILAAASVVVNGLDRPWTLIPFAAGSIVVSLLIDAQLGAFFTLILVVIVALNADLGLNFISASLLAGFTGVYAVRRVRHRSEIFRALLLVSIAYIFAVCAQGLMRGDFGLSLLTQSGLGVLNAFISTALAVFLIPFLELTCRVTTDLTLLELSDLNRPLLKKLMLEAPGTYHHSMVMGTLAEAAAEAVGANSLLARVQCYYHDIGKVQKPYYFVENVALQPQVLNPHDRLTPSMSCLILESHVREGVALARAHKIPEVLIDGIREHHGTMEMAYFYEKARNISPDVDREDFRYPGPRPRSRETAIVMLADGVEAASRVLNDPRPSRLEGLVERVVESRVEAGQLDECGLTLADLARIRSAFYHVLTGMFHGRIRYPAEADASVPRPHLEALTARREGGGGRTRH